MSRTTDVIVASTTGLIGLGARRGMQRLADRKRQRDARSNALAYLDETSNDWNPEEHYAAFAEAERFAEDLLGMGIVPPEHTTINGYEFEITEYGEVLPK